MPESVQCQLRGVICGPKSIRLGCVRRVTAPRPKTEVFVARPPAGRPSADEPDQPDDETAALDEDGASEDSDDPAEDDDADLDDADASVGSGDVDDDDDDDGVGDDAETERTRAADRFWTSVRIDPIEIALPGGVGYTLRAYRQNTEVMPADVSARDDEMPMPRRQVATAELDEDEFDEDDMIDQADAAELDEDELAEDDEGDETEDEEDGADEDVVEEVPIFLSQGGHLLLFRSPESLVDFVLSDVEHDLQQLDTWESATRSIRPEYVVSLPDDTYELDLVVKNLRGGQDAWDPQLIVRSGQLARDLSHALRVEPVMQALSPGSPLDDLDEALRDVAAGGFGSFFARRRLKKIGTQTATLGWRTVVGKISAIVDWRD